MRPNIMNYIDYLLYFTEIQNVKSHARCITCKKKKVYNGQRNTTRLFNSVYTSFLPSFPLYILLLCHFIL